MSCDPRRARSTRGEKIADGVANSGSVPDVVTPSRSAFRGAEGSPKILAALAEEWGLDIEKIEALRKEGEVLRASLEDERRDSGVLREESERLRAKVAKLENELRTLKAENTRLRGNAELLSEMKRILDSGKAVGVLGNEEETKDVEGEKGVPCEANSFSIENEDGGDGVGARKGNDSGVGGGASSPRKLRTMLYLGEGTCASATASAGSSDKSLVKESLLSLGDGRTKLKEVEVCNMDDDIAGLGHLSANCLSYQKPTDGKHLQGSNQERKKREVKRKRGSRLNLIEGENDCNNANGTGVSQARADGRKMNQNVSIVVCSSSPVSCGLHKSFNQSVQDVTVVKQHEPKNIKGKDSKNSSGKLAVVNSIAHENEVGSGAAKPGNGSSLCGGAWKNVDELLSDLEKHDELCMRAICALYRRQILAARKAMENGVCQGVCRGFSGLRVLRGISLGEFLTDRDPQFKLKRSVKELQDHGPRSLSDCRNIAIEHSNQLFAMYQQKEDPYFPTERSYFLFSGGS
ncbi:hypothetical protein BT93_E0595 [Corymbia citriodora subsp. variegata]|nr:hypothetical protein BT93_E0595 [Corymbia citriodora subsp. variegata]